MPLIYRRLMRYNRKAGKKIIGFFAGVHAGETLVAFAGRLVAEKGVLKLIDAVNRLRQEGEKLHLIVVGTGPLEEAVRAKEKEGIHFLGQFAIFAGGCTDAAKRCILFAYGVCRRVPNYGF